MTLDWAVSYNDVKEIDTITISGSHQLKSERSDEKSHATHEFFQATTKKSLVDSINPVENNDQTAADYVNELINKYWG